MARSRKINGRYYAYFYSRDREPNEKSWPLDIQRQTQRAARRELRKLEDAYDSGDFDPWNGGWKRERVSLSEAIDRFLDARQDTVRDRTLDQYETKLRAWARDCCPSEIQLRDLTPEHILSHVHDSEVAPATRQTRYRHVRMLLNWAEEAGLVEDNPLDEVKKPRGGKTEPEYLSPEQIEKLLRAIDAHAEMREGTGGTPADDGWLKTLIRLCLCTGLRRGEALALRWKDVDLEKGMLVVRHREEDDAPTKSGNERRVPLRGDALDTLRAEYEHRDPEPSAHIIVDSDNEPIRGDRVSHRFKFFVREANLSGQEQIRFHSLRHSCASWLIQQGVPLSVVSKILGHSSTQITDEIYAHVSDDAVTEAMDDVFGGIDGA